MEVTVSLPNQEIIDFSETCYALVDKQVSGVFVLSVGKTVEEAKDNFIKNINVTKTNYKRYTSAYVRLADLGVPSENKHHRGRTYEVAECDKKLYLYYVEGKYRYNNFIFDSVYPVMRLKYTGKRYHGK